MKFVITGIAILIVAVFIKWLWDQSKKYDQKSLKIIIAIALFLTAALSVLSSLDIEKHRVTSTLQGVITRLNVYHLRGQVTHYDVTLRGLAASGAFVSNQDLITIKPTDKNQHLIKQIQDAHKNRNVVFITFDTVTTYFIGDDSFELMSVEILPAVKKAQE